MYVLIGINYAIDSNLNEKQNTKIEINRKISKLENFRKCQKCIATIGHHPSEMN